MHGVAIHHPRLRHARSGRGWSFRGLHWTWRARRRPRGVFVEITHLADLPPG